MVSRNDEPREKHESAQIGKGVLSAELSMLGGSLLSSPETRQTFQPRETAKTTEAPGLNNLTLVGDDSSTKAKDGYRGKPADQGSSFSPSLDSSFGDFTISGKNEFNQWAGNRARAHNLVENSRRDLTEENAFRHTITSAIYAMKYGERTSLEMGWMNEQKDFNLYSSYRGKIDLAKIADTNADLLNNRAGVEIARRLMQEKGEDKVTVKDIEDAVIKALKEGKLVTRPMQELQSGRLAEEMLSYRRMPDLIKWQAENGPTEQDRRAARAIVRDRRL